MEASKNLIGWCADECERQQSGLESVDRMIEATLYCFSNEERRETWVDLVMKLGEMVDPIKNPYGFRRQPVTIDGKVIPVFDFYEKIKRICGYAAVFQITPEEWYQEFESLHPFNDGNGRVGAIMYNYLLGSDLDDMKVPPMFTGGVPSDYESLRKPLTVGFGFGEIFELISNMDEDF